MQSIVIETTLFLHRFTIDIMFYYVKIVKNITNWVWMLLGNLLMGNLKKI